MRSLRQNTRSAVRVAAVLVTLVIASTGCARPEDVAMTPGTCLSAEAKVQGRREANPPKVPCDDDHRYEVYAVGDFDPQVFATTNWPGEETVDAAGRQYCYDTFAANVGFEASEMGDEVRVLYIVPTASSWANQRDREVECLLVFERDRSGRLAQPVSETAEI